MNSKLKNVRRTVVLHPIMDQYIRKTWALLIDSGHDASYSTALNLMILYCIASIMNQGIDEKTKIIISSFLEDEETIKEINFEEMIVKLREALLER
jgi:hypothetical protein